ncbi:hypothetical protein POI8812_00645 [Pontivivens insulae]|uniref:Uncharacterized protein n=1 Tax=Pontivivens insulae TaxID=1639689 RepID=A0A2R8A7X4_9RHOB|nr:hypothetical protein DFR53_0644 [Pontivivens insulae]SPF28347.1 hypothetical protein POI8812_00645 [Pontivivens insulae]
MGPLAPVILCREWSEFYLEIVENKAITIRF